MTTLSKLKPPPTGHDERTIWATAFAIALASQDGREYAAQAMREHAAGVGYGTGEPWQVQRRAWTAYAVEHADGAVQTLRLGVLEALERDEQGPQ